MTNDGRIKTLQYTITFHRPDPDYQGPERRPDEARTVSFHSRSPFPVPRVGDDVERAVTFGDYGVRRQTPCRVSKVQHSLIDTHNGDELHSIVTVWTEEY